MFTFKGFFSFYLLQRLSWFSLGYSRFYVIKIFFTFFLQFLNSLKLFLSSTWARWDVELGHRKIFVSVCNHKICDSFFFGIWLVILNGIFLNRWYDFLVRLQLKIWHRSQFTRRSELYANFLRVTLSRNIFRYGWWIYRRIRSLIMFKVSYLNWCELRLVIIDISLTNFIVCFRI